VNIYPSTIDSVLSEVEGIGSEYQIHLFRDASERGMMRLIVEAGQGVTQGARMNSPREVARQMKRKVLVTPAVEVAPYGSLPRSERKESAGFRQPNSGFGCLSCFP
jgi:phenylacetate-CoA ligase